MAYRPIGQVHSSVPLQFAQPVQKITAFVSPSSTVTPGPSMVGPGQCLSLEQVKLLSTCFSPTPPPGVQQNVFTQSCAAAKRAKWFELPYCPGAETGLIPIPSCLDDLWSGVLGYCDQYPGSNGPEPFKNAVCWAAHKAPSYYAQIQATPKCSGEEPPPGEEEAPSQEPNYMLWGGLILLLVVAGGGVYYYTRKG